MTTLTIEQLHAIAAGERGIEGKQQKEIVSRLLTAEARVTELEKDALRLTRGIDTLENRAEAAERRVAELEAIVNTPVKFTDCDLAAVAHLSGGSVDYCSGFVDGTKNAMRVIETHGLKVE